MAEGSEHVPSPSSRPGQSAAEAVLSQELIDTYLGSVLDRIRMGFGRVADWSEVSEALESRGWQLSEQK